MLTEKHTRFQNQRGYFTKQNQQVTGEMKPTVWECNQPAGKES